MGDIANQSKQGSDQGRDKGRQDARHTPGQEPQPEGPLGNFPARASFDHPNWILDRVTSGTYPESTQVAMSRQFARVLGDMLGKNSASREESVSVLDKALESHARATNFEEYLFEAIDTVTQSHGLLKATENLVQSMGKELEGLKLSEKLAVVHSLTRATVSKMFSDMLDAPQDPVTMMSMSGDQSMHTVFGIRGEVESMAIKMTRGKLSHYFKQALEEAQERYDDKKRALQDGLVIPYDKVFKLTLTVEAQNPMTYEISQEVFSVKTTKEDLIASYNEALTRYAATGYADRVRDALPKAIEQRDPAKG